jgi:hypothetical protein
MNVYINHCLDPFSTLIVFEIMIHNIFLSVFINIIFFIFLT